MKRETAKGVHKGESGWQVAHKLADETPPPRDILCFHCQQAADKSSACVKRVANSRLIGPGAVRF
jgi:hypothetical protein